LTSPEAGFRVGKCDAALQLRRLMICGDVVSTISATRRSGTIRVSPSDRASDVLR
jgi:hypothetical protein